MVSSKASTPEAYLAELPPERREVISAVRDLVNQHMPNGYEESMAWGMVTWSIPLSRYPTTYNKQPLSYVALAAQKNYSALYLMNVAADSVFENRLREDYAARGKKLDMGKCCLRFKTLEELPQALIGEIVGSTDVDGYIASYEVSRGI